MGVEGDEALVEFETFRKTPENYLLLQQIVFREFGLLCVLNDLLGRQPQKTILTSKKHLTCCSTSCSRPASDESSSTDQRTDQTAQPCRA